MKASYHEKALVGALVGAFSAISPLQVRAGLGWAGLDWAGLGCSPGGCNGFLLDSLVPLISPAASRGRGAVLMR